MMKLATATVSSVVLIIVVGLACQAEFAIAGDPPDSRRPDLRPEDIRHHPSTLELQIDPGRIEDVLKQSTIEVEMRVAALNINGGATITDSRSVILNPAIWWTGVPPTHYRATEDESLLLQSDWIYMGDERLLPFELSEGESIKTVHFQVGLPQLGENWRSDAVSASILFKAPEDPSAKSNYYYNFAEAYALAVANGFQFSAEPADVTSKCVIEVPENSTELHMVAWGNAGMGSRCQFTIFTGRDLADGWSFVNDETGGYCEGGFSFGSRPEPGDRGIEYQAGLWTEGLRAEDIADYLSGNWTGNACYRVFVGLVLRGPAGAGHMDAFR